MKRYLLAGLLLLPTITTFANSEKSDPNLWLEEVDGEKALAWVKQTNLATDKSLASDPLYQSLYEDALSALNSKDKLPSINQRGDWIYNYWKDTEHPRGLYRRASARRHSAP